MRPKSLRTLSETTAYDRRLAASGRDHGGGVVSAFDSTSRAFEKYKNNGLLYIITVRGAVVDPNQFNRKDFLDEEKRRQEAAAGKDAAQQRLVRGD